MYIFQLEPIILHRHDLLSNKIEPIRAKRNFELSDIEVTSFTSLKQNELEGDSV